MEERLKIRIWELALLVFYHLSTGSSATQKIPVYDRLYANKFSKMQRITASQKEMKAKVAGRACRYCINILTETDDMEEFRDDTSDGANAGGENQINFMVDT